MLILSIFVFKETVSPVLLTGFALIWTALAVYAASSVRAASLPRQAKLNKRQLRTLSQVLSCRFFNVLDQSALLLSVNR